MWPGGGVAVQPGISNYAAELVHIYPYVREDKDRVLVFFGHLSNLQELILRRQEWSKKDKYQDILSDDVGAAITAVIMALYDKHQGQELLMLAELQVCSR